MTSFFATISLRKFCFEIDLASVLAVPNSRARLLSVAANLTDWTVQTLLPPFSESRRDHDSNPPFEWIFAFSAWAGKLCAQLTADEARTHVLDKILPLESGTSLMMMQNFMRLFSFYALIRPDTIKPDSLELWQQITTWLYENSQWQHSKNSGYLDREFQSCVLAVLFCSHSDLGPVTCMIEEGWPHLPTFQPFVTRAIREYGQHKSLFFIVLVFLKAGGFDLMPDPALAWLFDLAKAKKADQGFWEDNGVRTVELLRQLIERRRSTLTPAHRTAVTGIADIMVDNGIRGAGFLQQEMLREA